MRYVAFITGISQEEESNRMLMSEIEAKVVLDAHRGVMCICKSFKMYLFVSICVLCLCLYINIYIE